MKHNVNNCRKEKRKDIQKSLFFLKRVKTSLKEKFPENR